MPDGLWILDFMDLKSIIHGFRILKNMDLFSNPSRATDYDVDLISYFYSFVFCSASAGPNPRDFRKILNFVIIIEFVIICIRYRDC